MNFFIIFDITKSPSFIRIRAMRMKMDAKLFTLQMTLFKTEEPCRNSVARRNSECGIPKFTEDESGLRYLSSNKTAVKQVEP
jgi:hypothetical protein